MSFVQTMKENIAHYIDQIKIFIFGENNARLDKLIDSYYSMRAEKRKRVKYLGVFCGIILFVMVLLIYFYGLYNLQTKLNHATDVYLKIQEEKPNFIIVQNEYKQIAANITQVNKLENLIPEINLVATELNIQIDGLDTKIPLVIPLSSTQDLTADFNKVKIDFQIKSISIKRMIDFLIKVQKLPNKFAISNLEIVQVFGNKLYFNVNVSFITYIPKQPKG